MAETISTPGGPILLCAGTDAAAAARLAEAAADLLHQRPVVVLATWQPPPVMGAIDAVADALYDARADLRGSAQRSAAESAHAAAEVLEAHGMQVSPQVRPEEYTPWRMILDVADEIDAAVIVAGVSEDAARRPGALGRQARALAHRTHRPLLLVTPDGAAPDDAAVLFATDGSAHATRALRTAATLLRPRPAIVASVWRPVGDAAGLAMAAVPDDIARQGAERLDEAARLRSAGHAGDGVELLAGAGWAVQASTIKKARHVPSAIADAAGEHRAAAIVTGTRGRSRIAAALLGSTAEGVVRDSDRPVLLVPPPTG